MAGGSRCQGAGALTGLLTFAQKRGPQKRGQIYFPAKKGEKRGHNKQGVFAEEADFRDYLSALKGFKESYGVKVYGFCLMTNHVHLILEPGAKLVGLGQLTGTKRIADEVEAIIGRRIENRKQGRPRKDSDK